MEKDEVVKPAARRQVLERKVAHVGVSDDSVRHKGIFGAFEFLNRLAYSHLIQSKRPSAWRLSQPQQKRDRG